MTTTRNQGGITFEVDEASRERVEKALGDLKDKAPRALKNAVNKTAKQAKEDLAKKAQETYVVKKTRFTKAMRTQNATNTRPVATIHVTGEQLELKDYKVSPASYRPQSRPAAVRAKVLASSGMKALERRGDGGKTNKAFIIRFANGHTSVAQRKGGSRLPVKKLMSNSIPVMIGEKKKVYGIVEPNIYRNLMTNLQAEIEKVKSS